jgi:hypothetical protein
MSNLQFGTLRYFVRNAGAVDTLGAYNMGTLGSLIQRGYLERRGGVITATKLGQEAYESYHNSQPNYRQRAGELSDRVRLLLHIRELRAVKEAS